MKIVILDAQGGGMGRQLVEGLKKALPNQPLIAVGTNALATAAMLRAGADQVATGENAVVVCAGMADLILCPIGMVLCDAMLGEVTANMALRKCRWQRLSPRRWKKPWRGFRRLPSEAN